MKSWLADHASPWWILALVLCWPVVELSLLLHNTRPGAEQTAQALRYLMDCKKTGASSACLPSQTLATLGSIKAASAQSYEASKQIKETAKESLSLVQDVHKDTHQLLAAATETLQQATQIERGLQKSTDVLTKSSDEAIRAAGEALKTLNAPLLRLDALLATADKQLSENGTASKQTIEALTKTIGEMDLLIADPNIAKLLAETAGTAEHLSESAKSVDIALRPWREKANMLKTVLSKALGMLKFTAPLF